MKLISLKLVRIPNLPKEYTLEQNYPNLFYPIIIKKYQQFQKEFFSRISNPFQTLPV